MPQLWKARLRENFQILIKQMLYKSQNNLYQITNVKYQMLNQLLKYMTYPLSNRRHPDITKEQFRICYGTRAEKLDIFFLRINPNSITEFYSRCQVRLIFNAVTIVNFQMYSTITKFSDETLIAVVNPAFTNDTEEEIPVALPIVSVVTRLMC